MRKEAKKRKEAKYLPHKSSTGKWEKGPFEGHCQEDTPTNQPTH
jgi:hypothetical protein